MLNNAVLDLSHHNGSVDFTEVKESGVIGIIHKVTEGTSFVDNCYDKNKKAAKAAGLLWGAYHFLRPGNMQTQAEFFVASVGEYIDLYCADHEDDGVSVDDLKDFCNAVRDLVGLKPQVIIYSGHLLKEQVGDDEDAELADYPLWLAQYTSGTPSWPTQIWPQWWLWQYTEDGSCDGVNGDVDVNKYDGTAEELINEWGGEVKPKQPKPPPKPEIIRTVTVNITAPAGIKVVVDITHTGPSRRSDV